LALEREAKEELWQGEISSLSQTNTDFKRNASPLTTCTLHDAHWEQRKTNEESSVSA
jgi:hypothetical protein